jgi:hypothetical protein
MIDFVTTNGKPNWMYYVVSDAEGNVRFSSISQIEAEYFAVGLINRGEQRPDIFEFDRF